VIPDRTDVISLGSAGPSIARSIAPSRRPAAASCPPRSTPATAPEGSVGRPRRPPPSSPAARANEEGGQHAGAGVERWRGIRETPGRGRVGGVGAGGGALERGHHRRASGDAAVSAPVDTSHARTSPTSMAADAVADEVEVGDARGRERRGSAEQLVEHVGGGEGGRRHLHREGAAVAMGAASTV
jgi:hypothetical protein